MNSINPYVSIVMIIGTQREESETALEGVLAQQGLKEAEVLILDTATDRFAPLPGSDHAAVKVHRVMQAAPLGILRAQAVEMARGEVVAFVEHHAMVVPGWLEAVIRGFRAGHGGVGGEPGPLNPGQGISNAIALINFGFFLPIATARTVPILPANNSAYRRDLLLSFGDLLPLLFASEVLLDQRSIEKGYTLLLDPAAKFLHRNEETLAMGLWSNYYWNLIFGENLARLWKWPRWRRILQALATPAVPFVRYFKYMIHFWRSDRASVPILLKCTGIFLATQSAAALGIAVGALWGAGDAQMKFQDYELNCARSF